MDKKYSAKKVKLEDLVLDKDNPRFAELYNGSDLENEIVEYLLYTESADEIAEAISNANEFYDDRPLWVHKNNGKYIVKDGNRRCSAIKALQHPNYYKLNHPKFEIKELPVLEYKNLSDLETRIRLEHNSNLFKKWGRIAKAIEIYRLFSSGNSLESLTEIDSKPKDFIKTATFYYKAVSLMGEDFKKLVREGRGKQGKTIIFERLFKERKQCGYTFKNTGELLINNNEVFESFINAIVPYLINNPDTTSRTLDDIYKKSESFLDLLKPYGFPPKSTAKAITGTTSDNSQNSIYSESKKNSNSNGDSSKNNQNNNDTRHSIKNRPTLKRKKIPAALKNLIDECYNLDQNNFANSKTALTRVTFECVLKFVVENSIQSNGNILAISNHFQYAFKDRKGNKLPYTNFTNLKIKFSELIIDTGIRKAFEVLDLELPHQIIHSYRVGAIPKQAKDLCDNLIDLLEFMLQEESDLLNSLDITKL